MRRLSVILCLILLMTAGCGTPYMKETKQTTITLLHSWGTTEESHQAMRRIYEDFERENPDIKLNLVAMPSSERVEDKVRGMLSVGKIPNLIYTGGPGLNTLYPLMVERGYALDLMPYIKEDRELRKSITPEIYESFATDEGRLYVLTDVLHMSGYWYNINMFENAGITGIPKTWEEFIECCRKIAEWSDSIRHDIVPLNMNAEAAAYFTEAYMAENDPGKAEESVREDVFRKALEHVKEIAELSELRDAKFTYRDNIRSFNIGQSAMYVGGLWDEYLLNENLKIAYAPFPSEGGQNAGLSSVGPGYLVGNTGDDRQKEASVRFIKYMLSKPVQERILKEAGYIPSNPAVNVEELTADRERMCDSYRTIRQCEIVGKLPEHSWDKESLILYKDHIMNYLRDSISQDDFMIHMKK